MSLDQGILDEFAIEAMELLDEAEEALLQADKSADTKTMYNLVFRAFHSLKGSSGMVGFDELQRHLHLLEDYLQKSKDDFSKFKDSTDYYLKGVDAARKILNGEVVQFVYEVYGKQAVVKEEVLDLKKKKIIYLANSKVRPLSSEISSCTKALGFTVQYMTSEEVSALGLEKIEYDILMSDLDFLTLKELIPLSKVKFPLILIAEEILFEIQNHHIFQILKKSDSEVKVFLTIKNAFDSRLNLELFEKAKGLIMYMYSDLEESLLEKKKIDIQKALSLEIRSFIKNFTR